MSTPTPHQASAASGDPEEECLCTTVLSPLTSPVSRVSSPLLPSGAG